jgi:hypothetical protein
MCLTFRPCWYPRRLALKWSLLAAHDDSHRCHALSPRLLNDIDKQVNQSFIYISLLLYHIIAFAHQTHSSISFRQFTVGASGLFAFPDRYADGSTLGHYIEHINDGFAHCWSEGEQRQKDEGSRNDETHALQPLRNQKHWQRYLASFPTEKELVSGEDLMLGYQL